MLWIRSIYTTVIFLNAFLTVASGYKCLQCDDVLLPNLCDRVGECGTHELCVVEQYNTSTGSFRYRQLCMDKQKCGTAGSSAGSNALTCTECCHGDLCNAGGCGQKGFNPVLGPLCYACHLQIGAQSCNKIQQCGRDKDCSIHPVRRLGAPDDLFETKCTERHICAASKSSAILGRKRSTCSICCNSTLCNDYDPRPCIQSSTTTSAAPTTTKSFTTVPASPQGNAGHTNNPPCFDTAASCGPIFHYCTLDEYANWSKTNCRKTCNYC